MTQTARVIDQHRRFFVATVPVFLVFLVVFQPPLIWQIIALGPLIALLGLPHGALDHRVATTMWALRTLRQHTVFIAGYVGLTIAILALWIMAPGMALAAFLLYSAIHFSDDWRADFGSWKSLPLGVSVIAAPALFFKHEVATLFGFLVSEMTAEVLADKMHDIAVVAVVFSALYLAVNIRRAPWVSVEYALLFAAAVVTPPLIYFVIYFCGLHSPRHFLHTTAQLGLTPIQGLRATFPILTATLILTAFGAAILVGFKPAFETATLQIVFIGLAAVTVPHMLLTAVFRSVRQQ